jgi:S1-C subfamily serine protease
MQVPRFVLALSAACLATVAHAVDFGAIASGGSNAAVAGSTGSNGNFVISTENAPETAADGGFAVGNAVDVNAADYAITAACKPQSWTITQKSANSIQLSFSKIELPQGDALVAIAQNGVEVPVTPSTDGGETTTTGVLGSTIKLEYRPSPTCSAPTASFTLDKLIVRKTTVSKEAVCGVNTMENVKCFANSTVAEDRKMYELSKSVLRTQRVRNDGKIVVCTAWLWGNKGHIVTNNHCFFNQTMVDAAQFDFGVESPSCTTKCNPGSCKITRAVKGKSNVKFIASDPDLDIALLQINAPLADEIVSSFGYLRILFGMPAVGDEIYIPQHPGGAARQIAKTDDDSNKSIATIKSVNSAVVVDSTTYQGLIGYSADTESGSSGSPVISRSGNVVVGLHRIGYCNNAATPSKSLLGYLVPLAKANDGVFA